MNDALIDRFCDHLWLEDGLAKLTLAAYRRDLKIYGTWLEKERQHVLDVAVAGDIEAYLAWRFANKTQPRSAARYTSTLKRFYREPGEMIRLQPANSSMDPIRVPQSNVSLQGRVLAVLRKYKN